jgi:hypothetical protein
MADTVTTLSLITLAQEYRHDVVRQINRRCTLLKMLPIKVGSGKNIAWAPEYDAAIAENYSEGADASNFGGDAQTAAVLSWGLYRSNIHVSSLAMDASKNASSPVGNRARWAREVVNGSAKLASTLNAALYSGAGTGTTIGGLGVAIGSTTNTYATIDRSVGANSFFRPTVVDPGVSTAPTMALLRDDIRQIYEACGKNPDFAVCSPAVFNAIGGLFDNTRRYVQQVSTARGPITLDAGYGALEVDGVMFLKDKDATANQIFYLNSDHVWLEVLPPADVPDEVMNQVQADDGFGSVPLSFAYEKLAKLGASDRAQIRSTMQLVVDRPNSCGVRKNVAA